MSSFLVGWFNFSISQRCTLPLCNAKINVNNLPETNTDPEKQWLEDKMSFGDGLFSGAFQHWNCKAKGPQNWWSLLSPERNRAGAPRRKNMDLFWRTKKKKGERIAETFRGKKKTSNLSKKKKHLDDFWYSLIACWLARIQWQWETVEKRRLLFQKHQWWLNDINDDATLSFKCWLASRLIHWSSLIHRKLTLPHPRKVPQVLRDLNNV